MVAGRITENNFDLLLAKTQKEQAELKEKAVEARKRLDDEARLAVDAREWVESIQEYRDIAELDAATLNRLIKDSPPAARPPGCRQRTPGLPDAGSTGAYR